MALIGCVYSLINITEPKKYDVLYKKIRFDSIINVLKQRAIILLTLPWFIVFIMIGAVLTFLTVSTTRGFFMIQPVFLSAGIAGVGSLL
jgi:hypothetical protein